MKIAVLTFHRCINYGSYWQARCLLEALAGWGHEAVLLDARSRRIDIAEWRCALRPTLPTPVPRADRPLYARKLRAFAQAIEALPRSRPFALDEPQAMESFDAVVVGSDEVWNFHHPWYAAQPLFFSEGLRAPRRIAYAASFGQYPADFGMEAAWAARLRGFDAASVRDANSAGLVAQALGTVPERVLDPCLLSSGSPLAQDDGDGPEGPYAVVYGHNFSPWFAEGARRWAQQRGLRLVNIGYRNDWADAQWLDAGPLVFPGVLAGAQAVLTNFFHGCVFALRLQRPWACEGSAYRAIKVGDLLATLGAQAHQLGPNDDPAAWDAVLDAPPAAALMARLAAQRAASTRWLRGALQSELAAAPGLAGLGTAGAVFTQGPGHAGG